ncbi:hypothetical protein ACIOGZ_29455 [Kitasatospora sp. NPDC088160]
MGPCSLWALAERVHDRWAGAGRPTVYQLELTDGQQRVSGGPG